MAVSILPASVSAALKPIFFWRLFMAASSKITARFRPGRTGMVLFSVADTGIGIRENQKEKLFQFFSQLDQSRSKQFEGTGLGLAISRELVTAMGGRIWAESQPGCGSTFHFTVRLGVQAQHNGRRALLASRAV